MSVLDAVIVDDNRYLTCSADKYIRFWNGNSVTHIFKGHTDVSFIYDLVALPNGLLVSAGEDRSVRIWKGQALLQAITLPCISNWCLTNVGNDIVVGSSDNSIRIFTSDPERYAAKEDLERFEESVKTSTIAEQSVDINKTDVPGYERLEVHGTEGQTVMVKSPVGVIEAYQWSNGQWNKIGDVVGSSASSDKKVHNGKEYDYVFDVDFEDGKPPLKLPYNAGDNTYTVANQFLADNELPASYVQDVVAFLEKNTQGVSLTETSDSVETKAQVSLSVLPVTQYIQFKDINSSQLNRGLTKFNDSQTHKLSSIPTNFDVSSSEAADMITNLVPQVFEWDESSYLVGFDLLRSLIGKLGISDILKNENLPELVQSFIEKGAASENPSVLMMFGRFLNNLVDSVLFMQIYADSEGDNVTFSSALFQLLDTLTQKKVDQHHKHYNQCITGFSTLIYNLSAVQVKQKVGSGDLAKYINDTNIEEANYRLLIALGNLKYIKAVATPLPSWAHKHSEPRFISLFNDINSL
ncbi:PFU-domain-containing protein [Yamadazyma tenuis ATCC 10573]|uniref:PFU-domain-containing protein n=1 Tax=Candida tenuis (strain ATCC 10573 / BCRC 21748 / CBS 615 / JCM 9827 / NBRC 10315 / NRRL Y-1498 / VKM Y-70) TaxID=590646 RepID=G3B7D9_CANTC|nr:PFU-domain-containing protein [Yamadazyma tenuis ATCC 10573]EGV62251.1 PFU-domain-containing protein [Yamadazyma tenuis ATCC 10573]